MEAERPERSAVAVRRATVDDVGALVCSMQAFYAEGTGCSRSPCGSSVP